MLCGQRQVGYFFHSCFLAEVIVSQIFENAIASIILGIEDFKVVPCL
jgi:hypothetical protein